MGVRWWPCVIILLVAAVALAAIQFLGDTPQQARNMRSYITCGVTFIALLGWLLFYSRLGWQGKLAALAVIAALHLVGFATVRISGVDGNLVPILSWRWDSAAPPANAIALPAVTDPVPAKGDETSEWPQFLGPTRDGRAPALALETNWVIHPPAEEWRVSLGQAWSGFAVVAGRAITLEQHGDQEVAVCRDSSSGAPLWTHAWPARYSTTIGGTGPRTVPSIVGARVLLTGATGWLRCLRLDDGTLLWSRNVLEENGTEVPVWGYSVSPLVVGNRVILSVGGSGKRSLMAYDVVNGDLLWSGGEQKLSYSSPVFAELAGYPQIVVFNANGVAGHDVETGAVLWESNFNDQNVHVAAPLVIDTQRILVSAGYGVGSELFQVGLKSEGSWEVKQEWVSRRMKAKFANLVLRDGHIYGPDDGIMACISAAAGDLKWKDGRYGHGQMILTGDLLLMMAEDGRVVLIEASPEQLNELGSVRVFTDKTWNPPALSGNHLLLRNDREAVCLRLALTDPR